MTTPTRAEIADAFREARKYLWDGQGEKPSDKNSPICFALDRTGNPGAAAAKRVIAERLGEYAFLKTWLFARGVPLCDMTPLAIQTHRHQWLELLEKEFRE